MTKEDLYNQADCALDFGDRVDVVSVAMLDEFFEQNVCIPKGENRHPYADEWHQVLEGATFQSYNQSRDNFEDDQWIGYPIRIKPTEPIYEWQWYYGNQVFDIGFYTEDECSKFTNYYHWIKIEETKRIRQ